MRIRHYSSGTLHDFHKYDSEPYQLPEGVCKRCFQEKIGNPLANTYCFNVDWVILGEDDFYHTKNRSDYQNIQGRDENGDISADLPRMSLHPMAWGIQIRYYKDINA